MNITKQSWLIDLVSLLFFTILSVAALVLKEITIFYVMYIFWWDELIKTLFDGIRFIFNRNLIMDPSIFTIIWCVRFFMLCVYMMFIIVCFNVMVEEHNNVGYDKNIDVIFFRNVIFNITLLSFIVREAFNYVNHKKPTASITNLILPKGALVLHISIIFGMFAWFLSSNNVFHLSEGAEKYNTLFTIAPFILIKFLFDWSSLKNKKENAENLSLDR
ncbi:DUF6498-containing protein [uncultured Cytophaga sp.]|uniref:DUF6498-containing protein n=1 Tax=uncultured Cytophaga sp. TaxID=160238 RepID=UPI0026139E54|nr:DUF6498-containing protein [uncultured Cytophaga sp.]